MAGITYPIMNNYCLINDNNYYQSMLNLNLTDLLTIIDKQLKCNANISLSMTMIIIN